MNRHLVSRMHLGIACLLIASLMGVATLRFALTTTGFNSTLSINTGAADRPVVQEALNRLPLLFEPNLGQADQAAHFIARTNGADAFLGPTSAVFVLKGEAHANQRRVQAAHKINSKQALSPSFSVQIRGGNPRASSTGLNQLAGKSNYILGNNHAAWPTGVPNYAKVQFSNVYPGIDLVYYGNQRQLEYDFVVAP